MRLSSAAALGAAAVAAVVIVVEPFVLPAGAVEVPPPQVEPVAPRGNELVILPAVTAVTPQDGAVVVEHRIVNGTDRDLPIELSVRGIDRDSGRPDSDATLGAEVGLAADELRLAPSEAATVASVARGLSSGLAYAVVATVPNAEPPVELSSMVLAAESAAEVAIARPQLTSDRLEVDMSISDGPVLVDAAVRLSNWTGHVLLTTDEPNLVGWDDGEPIELRWALEGVVLPGPYRVDVVADAGAGEERLSATVWLFPEPAVMVTAAVLLAVTAIAILIGFRRRRRARAADRMTGADARSLDSTEQEDEDG